MSDRPFYYSHRVTYSECTLGNHVYHSRYLDLLEAARGALFRELKTDFLGWQQKGVIFPVVEACVHYRKPARYDDLLSIEVWPTAIERVRLNFAHRVRNAAGEMIVEAETFHACTGLDEKPQRIPSELVDLLRPRLSGSLSD